jgi:hypothetical protein
VDDILNQDLADVETAKQGSVEDNDVVEDDSKVVDDDKKADSSTDTETETDESKSDDDKSEDESDTETETVDPIAERFKELGLDKQFVDVNDMMSRITDTNRHLNTLESTNKELREKLQATQEDKPEVSKQLTREEFQEEFDVDPAAAMQKLGLVSQTDMKTLQDQVGTLKTANERLEYQADLDRIASNLKDAGGLDDVAAAFRLGRPPQPGVNKLWDTMTSIYDATPGLKTAGIDSLVTVLKPLAEAKLGTTGKPAKAKVGKVSSQDKTNASTTSGTRTGEEGAIDFGKMTADEIEKAFVQKGRVGD